MTNFESQLRLGTGLVLALYVVQHPVNHSFGIVSIEFSEAYRKTVGAMFQNTPAQISLYGSLLFHVAIALRSIYRRSRTTSVSSTRRAASAIRSWRSSTPERTNGGNPLEKKFATVKI